jgi:hypothetical protein
MRWAGQETREREKKNAYRILVGKPEGKRPLGRPERRCKGNIRISGDWMSSRADVDTGAEKLCLPLL